MTGTAPHALPRLAIPTRGLPALRNGRLRALLPLILPGVLLLAWHLATTHDWVAVQILPPPAMVLGTLRDLILDGTILQNLEISLARIGVGLLAGVSGGLVFGILLGVSPRAEQYLGPIFRAVAQVPSLGWLPILILLLGIDEPLKYIIIAKACVVPMTLCTAQGIRSVPAAHREVAAVFCLSRREVLFKLLIPAAMPSIFTGLRLAIGQGWVALVVVEMLAATEGVGYMMTWGRTLFQTDVVLVGMILIGVIGVLVDFGMRRLEHAAQRSTVAGGRSPKPVPARFWRGVLVPASLVAIWILASSLHLSTSPLLVSPGDVLRTPFVDPLGQTLWPDLGLSLMRMAAGFAIGAGLGLATGLAMGMSQTVERIVAPSFYGFRQITVFAWIPLLTAWFGAGDAAKIVFISLSAFFPMVVATYDGLRHVPERLKEVAAALELSWQRRASSLLLPAALPAILIGFELALMHAWIATVGAEYAMGLGEGIGTFITGGREQFRMDIVTIGVLVLALVGYMLNVALRRAIDKFLPWRQSLTQSH